MKDRSLLSLGSQTVIYGLSGAAVQIVGLITLPVFARVFSPSEYGVIEVGNVMFAFFAVVADAGMASASQRSYFDYSDDDVAKRRSVLATALVASTSAAVVLAILLAAFQGPLESAFFDGKDSASHVVVLVAVALPLSVLATLAREAMRLRFRAWHYVGSAALGTVVTAATGLALVLGAGVGAEGVFIGLVAGNVASTAYGFLVARRDFAGALSRPELGVMLRYGLPLIPTAVAAWALAFLDRVMLAQLSNLDEVGQYAIAARVGSVLTFAVTAFGLAYTPFIFSLYQEEPEAEPGIRSRALLLVTTSFMVMAVVLSLFAREVIEVVAPDFDRAYRVVGLLTLGLAAFGVSTIAMTGISYARRTGLFARYSVLAVVVNAGLNALLIPPLGMYGAATGTLVAFTLLALVYHRTSQRFARIELDRRAMTLVLALTALAIPVGAVDFPSPLISLAVKAGVLAVYLLALWRGRVLWPEEIARIREVAGRLRTRVRPAGSG